MLFSSLDMVEIKNVEKLVNNRCDRICPTNSLGLSVEFCREHTKEEDKQANRSGAPHRHSNDEKVHKRTSKKYSIYCDQRSIAFTETIIHDSSKPTTENSYQSKTTEDFAPAALRLDDKEKILSFVSTSLNDTAGNDQVTVERSHQPLVSTAGMLHKIDVPQLVITKKKRKVAYATVKTTEIASGVQSFLPVVTGKQHDILNFLYSNKKSFNATQMMDTIEAFKIVSAALPLDSDQRQALAEPTQIKPVLDISVLQAVGLMDRTEKHEFPQVNENIPSEFNKVVIRKKKEKTRVLTSLDRFQIKWNEISSRKRRFSETFILRKDDFRNDRRRRQQQQQQRRNEDCSHTQKQSKCNFTEHIIKSDMATASEGWGEMWLPATTPVLYIRGGGEILVDSNEDGSTAEQRAVSGEAFQDSRSKNLRNSQTSISQAPRSLENRKQNARAVDRSHVPQTTHDVDYQRRILWEDQTHSLAIMNSHIAVNQATASSNCIGGPTSAAAVRLQEHQTPASETYHHQSTLNALHLAQHLHHATTSITHRGGELGEYIGGIHHSTQRPSGFDWPSIGAASAAAMVAAHSSLAALELARHNAAMVGYSVQQDRAARALLAREQQSVVVSRQRSLSPATFLSSGASPNFSQAVQFSRTGAHSATRSAAHSATHSATSNANTSAQAALIVHPQLSISSSSHMRSSKSNDSRSQKPLKPDPALFEIEGKSGVDKPEEKLIDSNSKGTFSMQVIKKKIESKNCLRQKAESAAPSKRLFVELSGREIAPIDAGIALKPENTTTIKKRKTIPIVEPFLIEKVTQNCSSQAVEKKLREKPEKKAKKEISVLKQKMPQGEMANGSISVRSRGDDHLSIASEPTIQHDTKKCTGSNTTDKRCMQFFLPPAPKSLTQNITELIHTSRIHEATRTISESNCYGATMLEYLNSVGTAIPIPKALISVPLKERLNSPGFRNSTFSTGLTIPREVVIASILVWLWTQHEENFQSAFAKSGRIDVDPDCKWLIQAAVDSSVRALMLEISDAKLRGGGIYSSIFASPLRSSKASSTSKSMTGIYRADLDGFNQAPAKLELVTASIVSRALMIGICIDDDVDYALPQYHDIIEFLDECRLSALHSKAQERVLLASLISREVTMSESFSHAYVSSMVRGGEALGHDNLSEIVMDEDVMVGTMLPYDIFKDETGAWEDPCRPKEGFTPNLTGDILLRRAHARAMIQKSLKKLQERHNIKDGTPAFGAYDEPYNAKSSIGSASNVSGYKSGSGLGAGSPNPRVWTKRKLSTFSEPTVQPGTGSAQALNWAVYDPKHFSVPLAWRSDDIENMPYGQYNRSLRSRSLSFSQLSHRENKRGKKSKRSTSLSSSKSHSCVLPDTDIDERLSPSSSEISWTAISNIFQSVRLPGNTPASSTIESLPNKTIISPFVRKTSTSPVGSDTESDEEEDLRDETILDAHQFVLDRMKATLSEYLESRRKQQDRRKNRYKDKS